MTVLFLTGGLAKHLIETNFFLNNRRVLYAQNHCEKHLTILSMLFARNFIHPKRSLPFDHSFLQRKINFRNCNGKLTRRQASAKKGQLIVKNVNSTLITIVIVKTLYHTEKHYTRDTSGYCMGTPYF